MESSNVDWCIENVVSITGAMKVTGFTRQHLSKLCRNKAFTAKQDGSTWLIWKPSLEKYLSLNNKPGPKPSP